MYALLEDIINEQEYNELKVLCHVSLRDILKDTSLLRDAEKRYALNSHTHIDFSVINRVNTKMIPSIANNTFLILLPPELSAISFPVYLQSVCLLFRPHMD